MTDKVPSMPRWRILILALLMSIGFITLICSLHTVQVEDSGKYANSQYRQSVRRVLIPAARGRIFDRNGVCLAYNRPSYCIAVYAEELRKPGRWSNTVNSVNAKLDDLSQTLGIERQINRTDIEQHIAKRLPLPLLAWQDIDDTTLARFAESITPDCGMDIYVQPERVYPQGRSAAHLLGYIGRDIPVVTNETFHYNIMGMKGRSGIESSMNEVLSGTPGGKLITVDVSGYRHSETNRPAIPGKDVYLTIDTVLQQHLERLLGNRRGAAVAVDPRNGDILALVSSPSFDPNEMSPAVSSKLWKQLMNDKEKPLLNRAVTGTYPPGSVFKPCVALAALAAGVPQGITYDCNGVYTLGAMKLRCSARAGHGENITIRYGLEQSCNPFFCSLGTHIGIDAIRNFASKVGFGKRTGIRLGGESSGLLPDDAWKRRVYHDGWRTGDTANLAIGQGMLLATPLQIAMYTAAVANGGTLFKPRLVLPGEVREPKSPVLFPGEISNKISIPTEHLKIVRGGMYDVVNAQYGTGRRARVKGLKLAAKTGTAEYGSRSNRRKHTWMIAFAPFDNPEIALAVLVEDGESGGKTVAPIISEALREYFGLEEEGNDSGEDPNSDPEVNPSLQPETESELAGAASVLPQEVQP